MKRPIVIVAIGYIIGILEGLYLKISIVLFYILISIIYLIFKCIKHKKRLIVWDYFRYMRYVKLYINKQSILVFMIASIIANISITYQEQRYINLQTQLQKQDKLKIYGTIASNPQEKQYYTLYKLKTKQNLYFNIYINRSEDKMSYGQGVVIEGIFQMPKEQRNEGGFDYKQYLKTQKTLGIIQISNVEKISIKQDLIHVINTQANRVSNFLKERIQETIKNRETSGILIALILGDTSSISKNVIEDFRNASIAHILAISGMHISYIIFISSFIISKLLGKRNSYFFTIFILILYTFITGFSPSIVRAVLMNIFVLLSKIFYTRSDGLTNMGIAALAILVNNPYCILDIGFQLSFGGTLGIILFQNMIKRKKLKKIFIILLAQIFIFPISIYHFNTFSPYFIFTNLIVGILIAPIMISAFCFVILLCINLKLARIFAIIPEKAIKILILISKISKVPFSTIYVATPKIWHIVVYLLIIGFLLSIYHVYFSKRDNSTKKRFRQIVQMYKFYFIYRNPKKAKKIVKIISILVIFSVFIKIFYPNNLKIHFVDVGQGDCTFIETTRGKTILIDGGEDSILSYVLDRGYTKIDYVMISHFDSDHVVGILEILGKLKVGQVIIGKQGENSENFIKFIEIVKKKKIRVKIVKKGDKVIIDKDIYFDILWPQEDLIGDNILNNNAIVAKLNFKGFSMLFTGDIEEEAEENLVLEYKDTEVLKSKILKVGHHGSKTSSIKEFLEKVKPQIALIGVGENNKFGHPNQEVIERLRDIREQDI